MSPHEVIDLLELNAELLAALKAAREDVADKMSGSVWLQINTAIDKAERR